MKIYEWNDKLSLEEQKNGAYWERNMLALYYADGWYYDTKNNWEGWKRVLSLGKGYFTFHIPDDFDVGILPEIKPNWDGHTTKQKWQRIMNALEIKEDED